jgi:3-isopropylmalate dehydrogenase
VKEKKILAILPGDGIGPEIMSQALRVFNAVKGRSRYDFECNEGLIGGAAWAVSGSHFPEETKTLCLSSDAVLFGAVGGPVSEQHLPQWKGCEVNAILALRKLLGLYANLRPVKVDASLFSFSPLRLDPEISPPDLVVVRELAGDIYFGEKRRVTEHGIQVAYDECRYDEDQIRRVARVAFDLALKRRKNLVSVDKANVLETSRLWREVVTELAKEYSDVQFSSMLVDNCAMQIIKNPSRFDVLLTSNMFGDILSDMAAVFPGSLGMLDSSSIGEGRGILFEPPSGSAPDIVGKNLANPIGMIRCVASFFTLVTGELVIAKNIESGIQKMLEEGKGTSDLNLSSKLGTVDFTNELLDRIML